MNDADNYDPYEYECAPGSPGIQHLLALGAANADAAQWYDGPVPAGQEGGAAADGAGAVPAIDFDDSSDDCSDEDDADTDWEDAAGRDWKTPSARLLVDGYADAGGYADDALLPHLMDDALARYARDMRAPDAHGVDAVPTVTVAFKMAVRDAVAVLGGDEHPHHPPQQPPAPPPPASYDVLKLEYHAVDEFQRSAEALILAAMKERGTSEEAPRLALLFADLGLEDADVKVYKRRKLNKSTGHYEYGQVQLSVFMRDVQIDVCVLERVMVNATINVQRAGARGRRPRIRPVSSSSSSCPLAAPPGGGAPGAGAPGVGPEQQQAARFGRLMGVVGVVRAFIEALLSDSTRSDFHVRVAQYEIWRPICLTRCAARIAQSMTQETAREHANQVAAHSIMEKTLQIRTNPKYPEHKSVTKTSTITVVGWVTVVNEAAGTIIDGRAIAESADARDKMESIERFRDYCSARLCDADVVAYVREAIGAGVTQKCLGKNFRNAFLVVYRNTHGFGNKIR